MKNVIVLGGGGMLGRAMVARLVAVPEIELLVTARTPLSSPTQRVEQLDAENTASLGVLLGRLGPGDYVINCIGVTKQKINDSDLSDRRRAVKINSELPYVLAELAERYGFRVIQIATDCVYSGLTGPYSEEAEHDALDVYGKTKSLGEVPHPLFLNIRCSIIGREDSGHTSLVEWLLGQPKDATIRGYTDHRWNGVTTAVFADLAAGLVQSASQMSGTVHFIPADTMTKADLADAILARFGRSDVKVIKGPTGRPVDRTLGTSHIDVNDRLWLIAGRKVPPTIAEMVSEMPG